MNLAKYQIANLPLVNWKHIVLIIALLGSSPIFGQDAENFDATNSPQCSSDEIRLISHVFSKSLGVEGINPDAHHIGSYPNNGRSFLFYSYEDGWQPIRQDRQIFCGELEIFDTHDGFGDEMDWNLFLKAEGDNLDFIREALPYTCEFAANPNFTDWTQVKGWGRQIDPTPTIEAELTPDEDLYGLYWFKKGENSSPIINQEVCVYGPYVADLEHNGKPEIHPSEQIWWRDEADDSYFLMLIGDDSNRFDDASDFIFGPYIPNQPIAQPPDWWKVWAPENGLSGSFKIAFKMNINDVQRYDIHILDDSHQINSTTTHADADDGIQHAIEYRSNIILSVNEPSSFDDRLGVSFENICVTGDSIQGFIVITGTVNNGEGKEGMLLLNVNKQEAQAGQRIVNQWQYGGGVNPWNNLRIDEEALPITEFITSNHTGEGNVDKFVDFDGDGICDVFTKKGNQWMVSYNGTSEWTNLATSNRPLESLKFGDFNGDGITDIITNSADDWTISYSGTSSWTKVNRSSFEFSKFRVGDFDGDGKSDIISNDIGSFRFKISQGATGKWKDLDVPYFPWPSNSFGHPSFVKIPTNQLKFGDFNGDGKTDVMAFYYDNPFDNKKNTWWVSWGANTDWEKVYKDERRVAPNDLNFGNFDGSNDNSIDILYMDQDRWYYWFDIARHWSQSTLIQYPGNPNLIFGNFRTDRRNYPFRIIPQIVPVRPPLPPVADKLVPSFPKRGVVKGEFIQGSLKKKKLNGRRTMIMDAKVTYIPAETKAIALSEDAEEAENKISTVKSGDVNFPINKKCFLFPKAKQDPHEVNLRKLEAFPNDKTELKIRMTNNEKYSLEVPSFSVSSLKLNEEIKEANPAIPDSWKNVLKAVGGIYVKAPMKQPEAFMAIKSSQLEIIPTYAILKNESIALEEVSSIVKPLNRAIFEKNRKSLKKYFYQKNPFSISWEFQAQNIITGKKLPLSINQKKKDQIQISTQKGNYENSKVSFSFPETGEIIVILATATLRDEYGNTGTRVYWTSNYYCPLDSEKLKSFIEKNSMGTQLFKERAKGYAIDNKFTIRELIQLARIY